MSKHTPELLELVAAVRAGNRLGDAADTLLHYQAELMKEDSNAALLTIRDRAIDRLGAERDHLRATNAELLAALRGVMQHCVTGKGMPDKGKGRTEEQQIAYNAARAAIAKAEGQS